MNVVFLDYDGVVNTPRWYKRKDEDGIEKNDIKYNWPSDGKVNDEDSVQWVSEFCEKYDYKIVVSSTWRTNKNYVLCLKNAGLRDGIEVVGRTPGSYRDDRSEEIREYLSKNEVKNYLIFDDEDFFFYDKELHEHLVLCNPDYGFKLPEYLKAARLHEHFANKDIISDEQGK